MFARFSLFTLGCVASIALIASSAIASNHVIPGSSYRLDFLTQTGDLSNATSFLSTLTFDGNAENRTHPSAGLVSFTESETDLGGLFSRVDLTITAGQDIFPAGGGASRIAWGLGFGDPLNLTANTRLISASIRMLNASGTVMYENPTLPETFNMNPWSGASPTPSSYFTLSGHVGENIQRIEMSFNLVPAPGVISLAGVGLLAVARRRR